MKELNCKWYFGPQAKGNEKGPNNPTALTFKGTKYHSLIREAIQNSLDAVDDPNKPVKVEFDYRSFSGIEMPEFFRLKEHIQGCLNKYPTDENAKKLFTPMLNYFDKELFGQSIGYLRVVDSNTKGMPYDVSDSKSGFNAFISEGIASKPNGAGGSFGFGKAVFWMLSPISTVFVSSKTEDQVNFEGQTKLCTHFITPGEDLSPNGLYDTDGKGEVITSEELIPEEFRPKQKGTSVFVIGCECLDDIMKKNLVEAVLRNFWMAIHQNKLVVRIDNVEIDNEKLSKLMNEYFSEDSNNAKENYEYNPRPFYEIVINSEKNENGCKLIEESIVMNGINCPVKLYLRPSEDSNGQFVLMRKLLMTVYLEKISGCKGVDGVFVCDTQEGNDFLREMEDCSHDSWSRKNYEARGNSPSIVASHALTAIRQFISTIVKEELHQEDQKTAQMNGLEEILTIATPKGVSDTSMKDEIVDPVTLLDVKKKTPKKEKTKPNIRQPRQTRATFDSEGRLLSNSGGKRKKKREIKGPVKPGSLKNKSIEDENGTSGIYAVPVDVSYRTWCQEDENKNVWHIVRIFSNTEIENALIQLYGVDEEGKPFGLNIEQAEGYEIRDGEEFVDNTDFDENDTESKALSKQVKNAISGVHINANIPKTIKVRFNSDIKYSLRINSDKIETNESK